MSKRYQINEPSVIGETMDDETIIVNLDSGAYYSLRGTGATCWSLLAQGLTEAEIIAQLRTIYTGDPEAIATGVRDVLEQIEAEALVRPLEEPATGPTPDTAQTGTIQTGTVQLDASVAPQVFNPPVLEKFTDMADLLLLDPIHEVDEAAGWPLAR